MTERETGLKLDDLATRSGVSLRTIRYYVQRGLLPAPPFRGRDTTYTFDHLLRLRAIAHLQAQSRSLDEIQRLLDAASPEEMEKLARGEDGEVGVIPPSPVGGGGWERSGTGERGREVRVPVFPGERWERLSLAAGLELHLAESATPAVRELASQLLATIGQDLARKGR